MEQRSKGAKTQRSKDTNKDRRKPGRPRGQIRNEAAKQNWAFAALGALATLREAVRKDFESKSLEECKLSLDDAVAEFLVEGVGFFADDV